MSLTLVKRSGFCCFPIQEKVKGVDLSAFEFALKMKDEEIENGINVTALKGLNKVISLLKKAGWENEQDVLFRYNKRAEGL